MEIKSIREGMVPGTHTVTYTSPDDRIEIKHTLYSRRALALGAVVAAEFIASRKGVFTIDDLFE
jgi:4-hydroxy-tetrahydrodipicolinate reductase